MELSAFRPDAASVGPRTRAASWKWSARQPKRTVGHGLRWQITKQAVCQRTPPPLASPPGGHGAPHPLKTWSFDQNLRRQTVDFAVKMNPNPPNKNDPVVEETDMTISRRRLLAASASVPLAAPLIGAPWISGTAKAETKKLKISHQFPGGTIDTGDFRDQLCRRFAAELEKRTKGALGADIYPNSSLVKTVAQYSAMRKGALDMSLYPLNYAGGEVSEYNIGFMPGVVSSYDQGYAWKKAEIGKKLNALMAEKGAVLVTWLWQAGGSASREEKPILVPEDVKGKKVRGGSREMDLMLKGAGASVVSMPSNELYAAMQTGTMDVCMTTSTSFISFRLEEIAHSLTTSRKKSFFFVFEPLLMSKQVFDSLPADQQTAIMDIGAEMEKFSTDKAKADDDEVAKVYEKRAIKTYDMDQAQVDKWKAVAR